MALMVATNHAGHPPDAPPPSRGRVGTGGTNDRAAGGEADEFAAPLFIASQQSDRGVALYRLIQAYPDMPVALLTATPIRSTPWNLHSLLCFYGHYIDWKKWREVFFYLQKPDNGEFQYLDRPTWLKTDDWREAVALVLAKYADIVNLRDCVGELPPATEEIIRVQTPKYKKGIDDVAFYSEHRWEQQNKVKEILEIGKEYRKVLVVAFYKEQLKELQAALSKDRETFLVDGSVKDQESVTEAAAKSDECFLIVQADIGAGFDGDTFSCVVFVSMSYAVRSFVQMKFRVRRIHNLHPVVYNFLIGGRCDQAIYDNVQMGKTFVPSEWIQHNAP